MEVPRKIETISNDTPERTVPQSGDELLAVILRSGKTVRTNQDLAIETGLSQQQVNGYTHSLACRGKLVRIATGTFRVPAEVPPEPQAPDVKMPDVPQQVTQTAVLGSPELFGLIERLHAALPERIQVLGPSRCIRWGTSDTFDASWWTVQVGGQPYSLGEQQTGALSRLPCEDASQVAMLLAGLVEEVHVRGWVECVTNWRTHYMATVRGRYDLLWGHAQAGVGVLALGEAVLMALEAEGLGASPVDLIHVSQRNVTVDP